MIRDNAPIKYDEIVFPVYTVVVRSFINFLFGRRGKILVMYLKKKRAERRRLSGPSISCAPAFSHISVAWKEAGRRRRKMYKSVRSLRVYLNISARATMGVAPAAH